MRSLFKLGIVAALVAFVGVAYAAAYDRTERGKVQFKDGIGIGSTLAAGDRITKALATTSVYDPASVTATCTESAAITVTGAAVGDVCLVGPPVAAGTMNVSLTCYVSAANAAKIKVCNPTAGAIDVLTGTWSVRVFSAL